MNAQVMQQSATRDEGATLWLAAIAVIAFVMLLSWCAQALDPNASV